MNKKNLGLVSLCVGCVSFVAAIFFLINGILGLTDFSSYLSVATNIELGLYALVNIVAALGFAFAAFKLVMPFINKQEPNGEGKYVSLAAASYFCAVAVGNLITIIFNIKYVGARSWVIFILGAIGLVLVLCPLFAKLDKKASKIVLAVAGLLGFVLSIVELTTDGALSFATLVFFMLDFLVITCYFAFDFLIENNNNTTTATKAEVKEEAKAEEATEAKEASEDSETKAE